MVSVGDQCRYDEQCTGYSQCTNGYCRCPDGDAPTNGMCNTQSTGCKPYQVSVNSQCLDKVSIGQSCTNVAQCIRKFLIMSPFCIILTYSLQNCCITNC
ncbi:EB module [Ancylostoma caninum]|uniref:EB module n=1 Tax=Ancylostoma caninum TaxID=29170 RepID=A0A368F0K1_ANCCA|nr:EB module [Ancylostoma caninum]